ncbi:MAG TPA: right-handed parallel beta-helix repeat-containing protein [Thermoanaerobaculia bacterium]
MSRTFLLTLLFAIPTFAQNADLTVQLTPEAHYNAGEISTVRARVTNFGPDTATAAGVRLTKPAQRFVGATTFGCLEFSDSVLCNTATLNAGDSREFVVPFFPPDTAGPLTLAARTESFSVDPNHDNDAAQVVVDVERLADLALTITQDFSFRPGKTAKVFVRATNKAANRPATATVFVTLPSQFVVSKAVPCVKVDGASYRCTFPNFGRDGGGSASFEVLVPQPGPPVTITAAIDSSEPDWNPADNRVSLVAPIFDVYDLDIRIASADTLDASNRTTPTFAFTNTSDVAATDISAEIITYPGDPDATAAADGWTCKPSWIYRLMCTNPSIAPHATSTLRLPVQFSAHELRTALVANVTQKRSPDFRMLTQTASIDAVFYRPFRVTNAEDSGPGSLRQAILDANAACSSDDANPPCSVKFEIAGTIAPRSPLPRITITDFGIDGEGKILLDGSNAGDAEGLNINAAAAAVRRLTITGFARNGVLSIARNLAFAPRHQIIEQNSFRANGLRGVMALIFQGDITANEFSGNHRSGIFLTNFSNASIRDNRLIGNGASGIFVGGRSTAIVEHNDISGSRDFGVAIDRSSSAQVFENRIVENVQPGVDLGLDGPTLDGTPRITFARFNAATGETVIEGAVTLNPSLIAFVTNTAYVYANTRDEAGGEIFLGTAVIDANGKFTLRYRGDLTGKYIDAMKYQVTDFGDLIVRESSEFGARVRVFV